MNRARVFLPGVLVLLLCFLLAGCAGRGPAAGLNLEYARIPSDFSGMTPEIAGAYLAVVDELAEHLGYDEAEASVGECLHGGFVLDWDGDGSPELCLLLRTSPRSPEGWEGTPVYGWYAPTLRLYTIQNGQAVLAGDCDLYFATAGRESAVALLRGGDGMQCLRWDRHAIEEQGFVNCYALNSGALAEKQLPNDVAEAFQGTETAQAFLEALGDDRAQLLLYNSSGEARIEGQANARELRAALAKTAS